MVAAGEGEYPSHIQGALYLLASLYRSSFGGPCLCSLLASSELSESFGDELAPAGPAWLSELRS